MNGAKGVSALQLSRDLDCQYKTAFVLAHKLREAMGAEQRERRLHGDVEIDGRAEPLQKVSSQFAAPPVASDALVANARSACSSASSASANGLAVTCCILFELLIVLSKLFNQRSGESYRPFPVRAFKRPASPG